MKTEPNQSSTDMQFAVTPAASHPSRQQTACLIYKALGKMKILLTILALSIFTSKAEAVELGWHQSGSKGFDEVFELEKQADRVLQLNKHMKFDVGLGRIEKAEGGRLGSRSPIKFDFAEIEYFLMKERHKNLLVIWFDKTIMWNEEWVIADFISKIEFLTRPTGYKRIIILGAHGSGVHYVFDKTFDEK